MKFKGIELKDNTEAELLIELKSLILMTKMSLKNMVKNWKEN